MEKALTINDYPKTSNTVFLVMDIDGVFNSFYRTGTFKKEFYKNVTRKTIDNPSYEKQKLESLNNYQQYNNSYSEPAKFVIQWSKDFVKDFNDLATQENVHVIWLTTWRENSSVIVDLLSITSCNPMTYIEWGSDDSFYDHSQKINGLFDFLQLPKNNEALFNENAKLNDNHIKIVWVDDDAIPEKFLKNNPTILSPELSLYALQPDFRFGVSINEWLSVQDFIAF